ncbi:MAG TPA: LuxR C-terminal-related transcriptional regulator [Polyangiaceae bacterium]|nr:LuxR C-terminal-related transcriptional regulator [Polyangiaceae bacterium]
MANSVAHVRRDTELAIRDAEPELTPRWALATEGAAKSPRSIALAGVWDALVAGRQHIALSFSTEDRHYLVLREGDAGLPCLRESRRRLQVFERALLCPAQKAVALDFGTSTSAVSMLVKQALEGLGLSCTPSKVPVLVIALAHAAHGLTALTHGRWSDARGAGQPHFILSIARPDRAVCSALSPAEHGAVRLLLDGNSREAVARARGAAARTVANQLRSAFRKLGVSGRGELIQKLLRSAPSTLGVPERARGVSVERTTP